MPAGCDSAIGGDTRGGTQVTGSRHGGSGYVRGMETILRPLTVVGGSILLTLVIGWATDLLLRKADARHPETPLWGCCAEPASRTRSCSARRC